MGKKKFPFSITKRRKAIGIPNRPVKLQYLSPIQNGGNIVSGGGGGGGWAKLGRKKMGLRLWLSFDKLGHSELIECDRNAIVKRASIPARDLRIRGPVFSDTSNIVARENAMVVNLEFVKAVVTAQEVLLLGPLDQDVIYFIDQLKQQFPKKIPTWIDDNVADENEQVDLPFEFQFLEIALEAFCSFLESSAFKLVNNAYPILDDLAMDVSTSNLERVRCLKSKLNRLLARVQKVRDELEHLLDDDEDMAHMYLTRKECQIQQFDALMAAGGASNSIILERFKSRRIYGSGASRATNNNNNNNNNMQYSFDNDVEDAEMLLEAYFIQLDGTRNKILSVREYVNDTEDYVNIQLDHQRNGLIQLHLTLTIVSFAITIDTLIAGAFAMNIQCQLYDTPGIFWPFVGGTSFGCFLLLLLIFGYVRREKPHVS